MKIILIALLVLFCIGAPAALFFLSGPTALEFAEPVEVIGSETPLHIRAVNPHGIRALRVFIEQNGERHQIFETAEPANRWTFWLSQTPAQEVTAQAGTAAAPALTDGQATIIVEAQSNDLRGRMDTLTADVLVKTKPPSLVVDDHQHYINQGGSELVVFTVAGYWTEAGVRVGNYTFRSYPFPGSPAEGDSGKRFALFAFPWDVPADTVPVVYASNPTGAEATGRFWFKLFPKDFRTRQLPISESFVDTIAARIDPGGTGDALSRFLRINGEMRKQNNQTLSDLRLKTEERVLWSGPFVQLANSKVESQFADARDYMYQGRKVDHQVHLGFDLSVTQNTPVAAANAGKVLFAENLGIYGNCVVVDHGYGIQSIYAHLSEIGVKPGDAVAKGQLLGKSGATGLAGGDHLHFSMQVDGVQVNPVEWWDAHWLQDRIHSKLPAGP
jgi:murein DD-endopeptidase MepM/ murein hydrolase activator NlpD